MLFSTPYLFDAAAPVCSESVQTEPSMTVPDQSLTVREILDRFTRGVAPACAQVPVYDDREDLDFDDVNPAESPDFDLSDVDAHRRRLDLLSKEIKDVSKKSIKKVEKEEEKKDQPPPAVGPVSETP